MNDADASEWRHLLLLRLAAGVSRDRNIYAALKTYQYWRCPSAGALTCGNAPDLPVFLVVNAAILRPATVTQKVP